MTETRVAYELRAEYRDTYLGGLVRAGDHDLNVGELLEEGDGTIVLDAATDAIGVQVLDDYPALKRTRVPDDTAPAHVALEDKTVTELKSDAQARGITGTSSANKDELVRAITADDHRVAAGIPTPPDNSVAALSANPDDDDDDQPEA